MTYPKIALPSVSTALLAALALSAAAADPEPATPASATPTTTAPAATPAAATPKPAPKSRSADDAVTPAIKDPQRHAQFLERIKRGPIGLLFLGDSITDFFPGRAKDVWAKYASEQPADFGISADRTEHVLWRITNGELDGIAPKVVVLMIGTNNIGHFSDEKPEWAANGVKKIVQVIHEKLPQTKVLLLGVFPRDGKDSVHRKEIEEINRIISGLDDGKTTRYLDIGKGFLDEIGELPADIMPDKLHPTAKGYAIWHDAMQPLLDEMLK